MTSSDEFFEFFGNIGIVNKTGEPLSLNTGTGGENRQSRVRTGGPADASFLVDNDLGVLVKSSLFEALFKKFDLLGSQNHRIFFDVSGEFEAEVIGIMTD